MSLSLPSDPSLRQLKVLAKDLHRAHKRGDADCCLVLRKLNRFTDAEDAAILSAAVSLGDIQFAMALDYGFESWAKLKASVSATDSAARPASGRNTAPAAAREWPEELLHGFRYDPAELVGNESSLRGAVLRKLVFKNPRAGDDDVLEAHYQEVFAQQESDGGVKGESDPLNNVHGAFYGLLDLGYSPDRPEMQLALAKLVSGQGPAARRPD